jgi:hypothetical protein
VEFYGVKTMSGRLRLGGAALGVAALLLSGTATLAAPAPVQGNAAVTSKAQDPLATLRAKAAKAKQLAINAAKGARQARNEAFAISAKADAASAALTAAQSDAAGFDLQGSTRSTVNTLTANTNGQAVRDAQMAVQMAQMAVDQARTQSQMANIAPFATKPDNPAVLQQNNMFSDINAQAAEAQLSMAQQQLARAQTAQVQGDLIAQGQQLQNRGAARYAGRGLLQARANYGRLALLAQAAETKAQAYEKAAAQAQRDAKAAAAALAKAEGK